MHNIHYIDKTYQSLDDTIQHLREVSRKIAELTAIKETLTNNIIESLGHNHEGQKTYSLGYLKVEVRTPCIYMLDKSRYEDLKNKLPAEYNPVTESISYSIDKKLCDKALLSAPKRIKDMLSELISKKPGKATVSIRECV